MVCLSPPLAREDVFCDTILKRMGCWFVREETFVDDMRGVIRSVVDIGVKHGAICDLRCVCVYLTCMCCASLLWW